MLRIILRILLLYRAVKADWYIKSESERHARGWAVACDGLNNVFVSGSQQGSMIVSTATSAIINWDATSDAAGFVMKFNTDGNIEWAIRLESVGNDGGWSLAIDSDNNVYVAASYRTDTLRFIDTAGTSITLPNSGSTDAVLIKFTNSGRFLWQSRVAGSNWQVAFAVAVDAQNNVAFGGSYMSQTSVFDMSSRVVASLPVYSRKDIFVIKLTSSGQVIWSTNPYTLSVPAWEEVNGMTFDSNGMLYITGHTAITQSNTFSNVPTEKFYQGYWDNATTDGFVAKLSQSGTLDWMTRFSSAGNDYITSAKFDQHSDAVLVGGWFQNGDLEITTAGQSYSIINRGGYDGFVARLRSSDGTVKWAETIGGTDNDQVYSVAVDAASNIYVGGTKASNGFLIQYNSSNAMIRAIETQGDPLSSMVFSAIDVDARRDAIATGWMNGRVQIDTQALNIQTSSSNYFKFFLVKLTLNQAALSPVSTSTYSAASTAKVTSRTNTRSISIPSSKEYEEDASAQEIPPAQVLDVVLLTGIIIGVFVTTAGIAIILTYKMTRTTPKPTTKSATQLLSSSFPALASSDSKDVEPLPSRKDTKVRTATLTWQSTQHELSVPGFLELTWGTDYRRGAYITKGGGGSMYECLEPRAKLQNIAGIHRLVIKEINSSLDSMSYRQKTAFWQELAIMYKFRDHPLFCKMYGYSTQPVSLVVEFYQFGDLGSFIEGRTKSLTMFRYTNWRVIDLFMQYCSAIAHMHSEGIAHCDVKPQNVLLNVVSGRLIPIVIDFGVSRVVSDQSLLVKAFEVSDLKGASLAYAAPDVLFMLRSRVNPRNPNVWYAADTYSLAMTCLEMLNRKTPWY